MDAASRKALVDDAGRVYTLKKELAALKTERDKLDQDIKQTERKLGDATKAFEATCERLATPRNGASGGAADEEPLTPGKVPHRVLLHMRRAPTHLYTAAEIATDLKINDVQQVRTALARLVSKELVRRAGVKGQFTI